MDEMQVGCDSLILLYSLKTSCASSTAAALNKRGLYLSEECGREQPTGSDHEDKRWGMVCSSSAGAVC